MLSLLFQCVFSVKTAELDNGRPNLNRGSARHAEQRKLKCVVEDEVGALQWEC